MPGAARLGDIGSAHGCFAPTPIISASNGVFINGKPAARLGDAIDCGGIIISASNDVIIG